jgi:hypothetical protein
MDPPVGPAATRPSTGETAISGEPGFQSHGRGKVWDWLVRGNKSAEVRRPRQWDGRKPRRFVHLFVDAASPHEAFERAMQFPQYPWDGRPGRCSASPLFLAPPRRGGPLKHGLRSMPRVQSLFRKTDRRHRSTLPSRQRSYAWACCPRIVATTAEKSRSPAPASAASSSHAREASASFRSRPAPSAASVTSRMSLSASLSLKLGG